MKLARTNHPRYRWKVAGDYFVRLEALRGHKGVRSIRGEDGTLYAQLVNDRLTIFKGYHFDGCTLAPDFDEALEGCGVHDVLLQILDVYPDAYPEQAAHDALLEVQRSNNFSLARLYHWAVSGWPRQLYKLVFRKSPTKEPV